MVENPDPHTATDPAAEEVEIAKLVRSRRDEPSRPLSEFAAELGFDPNAYE